MKRRLTVSDYSDMRAVVREYLGDPSKSVTSSWLHKMWFHATDLVLGIGNRQVLGMCFYGFSVGGTKIHVKRCENKKTFVLTFLHELTHKAIHELDLSIDPTHEELACDRTAEYLYKRMTRSDRRRILAFRG